MGNSFQIPTNWLSEVDGYLQSSISYDCEFLEDKAELLSGWKLKLFAKGYDAKAAFEIIDRACLFFFDGLTDRQKEYLQAEEYYNQISMQNGY